MQVRAAIADKAKVCVISIFYVIPNLSWMQSLYNSFIRLPRLRWVQIIQTLVSPGFVFSIDRLLPKSNRFEWSNPIFKLAMAWLIFGCCGGGIWVGLGVGNLSFHDPWSSGLWYPLVGAFGWGMACKSWIWTFDNVHEERSVTSIDVITLAKLEKSNVSESPL